jgi:hypothetical protein
MFMNLLVCRFKLLRALILGGLLSLGGGLRADAYTLIVAPARYSVLQVAFDVLQRTPSVLVSYQGEGSTAEPVLHAWNGGEWVFVSLKDYREVNFLQQVPDRTILIGSDEVLPAVLVEASSWSSDIVRARDLNTSALVNEIGGALKWKAADWRWFAARYNLTLEDEAAPRRKSSWYDQAGPLPNRPHPLSAVTEHNTSDLRPVPVLTVSPAEEAAPVDVAPVVAPEPAPIMDAPAPAAEPAPAIENVPVADESAEQPAEKPARKARKSKAKPVADALVDEPAPAASVLGDPDASPNP